MGSGGGHPLDDEAITVTVSITHRATLMTSVSSRTTEADDGVSVHDILKQAEEEALDDLLNQLEQR